jgi:hypothetical protein
VAKKKHRRDHSTPRQAPASRAFSFEALPGWAVPALLMGATLLFFLPFVFSNKMIYGSDALNGIYSKIFYADFFHKHFTFPRWLSVTLGGMPTLDAFMGDMFYPLALLQFIMSVPRALGFKYLFTVLIAGLTMYLFLKRGLSLRREAALLGALCYMFNAQFISHMFPGHDGKMFVISLLPLSLYGLKRMLDTREVRYLVVAACGIGLSLLTSHVQTTYFSLWGLFFYFLFETIRDHVRSRNKKVLLARTLLFTGTVAVGLGIGMVQFLPPYQFTKAYSVRGEGEKTTYEHATSWSIHPEETASLVVPEFSGFQDKAQAGVRYWGRNPFKLNTEYAGIVALVFAVLFAFMFRKDPFVVFWLGMALFALIFALGGTTPFFYLFYHLVPGVKLFRAPSMIMFWFSFSLSVITAYGLNRLFVQEGAVLPATREVYAGKMFKALGVLAGLTVLVSIGKGLVSGLWGGIIFPAMTDQQKQAFNANYPQFIKGAWFSLLFGGAALYAAHLYLRDRLRKNAFIIVLAVVAVADLFRVDAYFYKLVRPSDYISQSDPLLMSLSGRQKQEMFRVFPVPGHLGNSDAQLHGLESVSGFHDNELKWYREFRGGPQGRNFLYLLQQRKIEGNPFLDLLNTRYIIYRPGQNRPLTYQENKGYMPRAFCVSDYAVVREQEIVGTLRDPAFPYRTKVLLEEDPPAYVPAAPDTGVSGPAGTVTRIKYDGEKRTYEVNMARPGFLVLSEVYVPYWRAFENGKEKKVLKTDLALMSVPLQAGKHAIVMEYRSPYIKKGAVLTFLSIGICILLTVFSYLKRKKTSIP